MTPVTATVRAVAAAARRAGGEGLRVKIAGVEIARAEIGRVDLFDVSAVLGQRRLVGQSLFGKFSLRDSSTAS